MLCYEVMNIWKSYMWTAGWRIIWKEIIAVIDATFAVAKRKPDFRNCKSCVYNCDDLLSYNYVMLCEWLNINKQISEIKWTLLSTRWGIAWRHRERLLKRLRQVKLHPFSQVLVSHRVTQSINKWVSFPRNWSKRNVRNSNTLQYFPASFESFLNTSLTREVRLLWVCQLKLVLWRRVPL